MVRHLFELCERLVFNAKSLQTAFKKTAKPGCQRLAINYKWLRLKKALAYF
jgi:hypothetical protein